MIHYHGLPITPETVAARVISGGHAFVSFRHADQLPIAAELAQSFAVDNGAFSAWKSGKPVTDWSGYYEWVADVMMHPGFDFAVIPDVIDGDEAANDALLNEWPHSRLVGAPVWHMHESLERLTMLSIDWPRLCLGSSGAYATIGTLAWWNRMSDAMGACCNSKGQPRAKLHGLRMLDPEIFSKFPFSSADSTNIARNVGLDMKWRGPYTPATKEARGVVMRERIESRNSCAVWDATRHHFQPEFSL